LSKKKFQKTPSRGYSLHKATVRLVAYRPSPILFAAVIMGVSIFLLGGGVYNILMTPISVLPYGSGRFISFIPYRIHEQLLTGSIGVMILYVIGAVGLLVIYQSTKYIRNPTQVSLLTKVGVALLVVAFIAVEAVMFWIMHFQ
jgi:hypothetical protein